MKSALLVVNDPVAKLRLLRILGRHGWWVDTAANVEGALEFMKGPPADITLVDRDIDGGSGLTLLRAIRMHPSWGATPIVMMHEPVHGADLERAFELGANDFLPRPFTEFDVLLRFERWVVEYARPSGWELTG